MLFPLAQLGAARAAVLLDDTAKARSAYKAFLTLWKDADAHLPQMRDARLEYSRLH